MAVETHLISVHTRGDTVVVDLSANLEGVLESGNITNGIVTVFVQSSTCGISTTTFDPGLANEDIKATYDRMVPDSGYYAHNFNNETDNGHSHVRALVQGPSITVPLVNGKMTRGSAQQVVIIDFDTRPRKRDIFVQIIGE
jgi:secondary thiamine-phosphate synthase enzyme